MMGGTGVGERETLTEARCTAAFTCIVVWSVAFKSILL